jgi:sec-independent protein translocase protein TatB
MFDIGGPELLLLLILGLLIFGPRRLPQIGRQLGGFVGQMRQALRDVQGTLEREVSLDEVRRAAQQVRDFKAEAAGAVRRLTEPPPVTVEPAPPTSAGASTADSDDVPPISGTPGSAPPAGPAG